MQPLPELTLRDIDTRIAHCPAGSIGTIVAAHPEYGYYLVESDALSENDARPICRASGG